MLRVLAPLFLAPLGVLMFPASLWDDQVIYQPPDSSVIQSPATITSSSAVQLVYQFPGRTKLENLATRSNGDLILTQVNQPFVYYLDPTARKPSPKVLYHFPNCSGMTGVVETDPDVFVVIAGNWSDTNYTAIPGTFSAWSIDFNAREPTVKMITPIPEAHGLNGLTGIEGSPEIVLMADSDLGAVWRLNVKTRDYSVAIRNPLFSPCQKPFPIEINGIGTFGQKVYFLNSAEGFYGRIPLTNDGGAAGEVQILARQGKGITAYDDFAMDWEGNAWVATHPNMLVEITTEGKQRNFTADDSNVAMTQPTSAVFGRGSKKAENTLYLTTAGSDKVGGQVFGVNTCLL